MTAPHFGQALGDWQRFTALRAACPGCSHAGERKAHDLCGKREHQNGLLVDCWRLVGRSVAGEWHDLGNIGGQGCHRFFIPHEAERASPGTRPSQRPDSNGASPRKDLPISSLVAWCQFLHGYSKKLHRANRAAVEGFYRDRNVPFDAQLYGVGPSRLEAKELAQTWLPRFLNKAGLPSFNGLPGVAASSIGPGAFFPAAKHGEAWEWIFGPSGDMRSWARRFLHPDKECADHPKAKSPVGAHHHVHHCPGWRSHVETNGSLLITEGIRKANEVQRRTSIGSLGLPSVAISPRIRDDLANTIRDTRPTFLLLAPDFADVADGDVRHDSTRHQVLGWKGLVELAREAGIQVGALAWDPALGKGIDDVFAHLRWVSP